MRISKIFEIPTIMILLFVREKDEVRHNDLTRLISSRGTLSYSMKELEEEGLLKRRIVTSKPIQSFYSLTEKGGAIATKFDEIKDEIQN